jgi:hypothetical protein
MIYARDLDRLWEIQERTTSSDGFSSEGTVSWTTIKKAWGSWEPMKGAVHFSAPFMGSHEPHAFLIVVHETVPSELKPSLLVVRS